MELPFAARHQLCAPMVADVPFDMALEGLTAADAPYQNSRSWSRARHVPDRDAPHHTRRPACGVPTERSDS
jgi:hypothetical protein